ncbi:MAG: hypothetical protein QXZ41_07545 [Ignisphaera sp.]
MELTEALSISLVNTIVVLLVIIFSVKRVSRIKLYGPYLFQLDKDESGNPILKKVPVGSVTEGLIEDLKRKALSKLEHEFKPLDKIVRWPCITILTLTIFTIHLVMLLLLF